MYVFQTNMFYRCLKLIHFLWKTIVTILHWFIVLYLLSLPEQPTPTSHSRQIKQVVPSWIQVIKLSVSVCISVGVLSFISLKQSCQINRFDSF